MDLPPPASPPFRQLRQVPKVLVGFFLKHSQGLHRNPCPPFKSIDGGATGGGGLRGMLTLDIFQRTSRRLFQRISQRVSQMYVQRIGQGID